jgi:hypothetical protein
VKDTTWDKFDYKTTRTLADGIPRIQTHLDRKLASLDWRHMTSQKEDDIVEC